MAKKKKYPKLRVWWIPQIPMQAFYFEVETPWQGKQLLDCLALYDLFQLEHNVKPDFSNAGGLQEFNPKDKTDGPTGSWYEWNNEDGDEIDQLTVEQLEELR